MKLARVAAVLAGAIVLGGLWLDWLELYSRDAGTGTPVGSAVRGVLGIDLDLGLVALAASVGVIVFGIGTLIRRGGRLLGFLQLLAGGAAVAAAVLVLVDLETVFVEHEIAKLVAAGSTLEGARTNIEGFIAFGAVGVRAGIGLYVTFFGGAVAVVTGVIGVAAGRTGSTEERVEISSTRGRSEEPRPPLEPALTAAPAADVEEPPTDPAPDGPDRQAASEPNPPPRDADEWQ